MKRSALLVVVVAVLVGLAVCAPTPLGEEDKARFDALFQAVVSGAGPDDPPGLLDGVEVLYDPLTGYGLYATRDMEEGELFIRVPRSLFVGVDHEKRAGTLNPDVETALSVAEDDPTERAVLYMLLERNLGDASRHAAYFATLPTDYDMVVAWTEEEMEWLKGTALYSYGEKQRRSVDSSYRMVRQALDALVEAGSVPAELVAFDLEEWRWGFAMSFSRVQVVGFFPDGIRSESSAQRESALVPIADLMNAGSTIEELSIVPDMELNAIVYRTRRAISAGEPILTVYGSNMRRMTDMEYAMSYGFVPIDSPHRVSMLPIAIDGAQTQGWTWKAPLIEATFGQHYELFPVVMGGDHEGMTLFPYMRIIAGVRKEEPLIRKSGSNRPVSARNERAMLHQVVRAVKETLEAQTMSDDAVADVIAEGALAAPRKYMAAVLLQRDREVLRSFLSYLEHQLSLSYAQRKQVVADSLRRQEREAREEAKARRKWQKEQKMAQQQAEEVPEDGPGVKDEL